jgi:thioesterase domain-containing protein
MHQKPVYDDALAQIAEQFRSMPPVAALQLRVEGFDGHCLSLHAPLAANINDKGCAFGGSLVSLMTLAGWGVVTLRVQQAGLGADVFVADMQVRYRAPLFADLQAEARLTDDQSWDAALARLHEHGRADLSVSSRVILPDGGIAAESTARYVALVKH